MFRSLVVFGCLAPLFAVGRQEVVYKATPQGELKLTFFYPAGWKASDARPGALFFFGGGFRNGSPKQFFSKAAYLASRGMVAASAEYRIESKHKTTKAEALEDCLSAMTWLKQNASAHGMDPARIAAGGGSAGGVCALHLLSKPETTPGLLLLYNPGMTDAPLRAGLPPMVMFFGTEDLLYAQARSYFDKTLALKNRLEIYSAKGQKHGFFNDKPGGDYSWHASTLYMTDSFLIRNGYLTGRPAIAQPPGSKAVLFSEAARIPAPAAPRPLPPGVRAERDIVYAKVGEREVKLDVYLPAQAPAKPLPLIVWIHGGAWRAGSKEAAPVIPFVGRGYIAASVGYRYTQEAPFPANAKDCKAAIRWLRENAAKYSIDPNRIGIWGSSAGGHLVAFLGTTGDVPEFGENAGVQAVVDWYGPTRVARMSHHPSTMDHDAPDSPENQLIGALVQQNPELAENANPAKYASRNDPPFLIQHGDADPLVPAEQSEILFEALKAKGAQATFDLIPGGGHGGPKFQTPENLKRVQEFFDRILRP